MSLKFDMHCEKCGRKTPHTMTGGPTLTCLDCGYKVEASETDHAIIERVSDKNGKWNPKPLS